MNDKSHEIPMVAILLFGWQPEAPIGLPDDQQFRWHRIQAIGAKRQAREIWISAAVALVAFVGAGQEVDPVVELLRMLRQTGPPVLVAIVDPPDPGIERLLRQAGAIYLCGTEAQVQLLELLHQTLCTLGVG